MYGFRALALGQAAVMCTGGKLNSCDGLSSLESISCKATRVDTDGQVIPLRPVVPFSKAEAQHLSLENRFKDKECQWVSLHEAWLEERRAWEGSRKVLMLEVSRLRVQSQALKESIQNPITNKKVDVEALASMVQDVIALFVKEDGDPIPQTRFSSRKWEATVGPADSAQEDADLLNRCRPDNKLDTVDDYVTAEIEAGNMEDLLQGEEVRGSCTSVTHVVDGIPVVQSVVDLATEACSEKGEMFIIVTAETSECEGQLPCLSVNHPGPLSVDHLGHPGPLDMLAGTGDVPACDDGKLLIGDQNQLGTVRLKELNVHSYVHGALKASHMRWWQKNRVVDETFS